jgi:hypothetical protein
VLDIAFGDYRHDDIFRHEDDNSRADRPEQDDTPHDVAGAATAAHQGLYPMPSGSGWTTIGRVSRIRARQPGRTEV